MDRRPTHLPDYKAPPVNEVVLGIQFAELKQLGSVHAGLFWSRIRSKFTKAAEQPPLPKTFEMFGSDLRMMMTPTMELSPMPPMHRYWFIDEGEAELIQLQRDRLFHNWRKTTSDAEYPHFEAISDSFRQSVRLLEQFLHDERLGTLECNQCEVTYINHIAVQADEGFSAATKRVFGEWFALDAPAFKSLEDTAIALKYQISIDGKVRGRLHVSIQPAVQATGQSLLVMELTARGRPVSDDAEGYLSFMRHAREAIVMKFTKLTSKEMHKAWGRTQ